MHDGRPAWLPLVYLALADYCPKFYKLEQNLAEFESVDSRGPLPRSTCPPDNSVQLVDWLQSPHRYALQFHFSRLSELFLYSDDPRKQLTGPGYYIINRDQDGTL